MYLTPIRVLHEGIYLAPIRLLDKDNRHINCCVMQGFLALRKAVTTHVKKYLSFSSVFDVANQLMTHYSHFVLLSQVDEWTTKPSPFSIQGHLNVWFFFIDYGDKTWKNLYCILKAILLSFTFLCFRKL